MVDLVFYQQKRDDGGVRSGIDVNGASVWYVFDRGRVDEPDPALAWYVEVRCEGEHLPADDEQARDWFRQQRSVIAKALRALAERFEVGFDNEFWPVRSGVAAAPENVSIEIVVSARRRGTALELPRVLKRLARSWDALLTRLKPLEPAQWAPGQ